MKRKRQVKQSDLLTGVAGAGFACAEVSPNSGISAKVRKYAGRQYGGRAGANFRCQAPAHPHPGSHSDLGQNKENSPRLSTLSFSTPITDNEPRTVCIVVTMKCEYPRTLPRRHVIPVHATDNAFTQSLRAAESQSSPEADTQARRYAIRLCSTTADHEESPLCNEVRRKRAEQHDRDGSFSFAKTIYSSKNETPPNIFNHRSSSSKPKMPARKHTRSRTHW